MEKSYKFGKIYAILLIIIESLSTIFSIYALINVFKDIGTLGSNAIAYQTVNAVTALLETIVQIVLSALIIIQANCKKKVAFINLLSISFSVQFLQGLTFSCTTFLISCIELGGSYFASASFEFVTKFLLYSAFGLLFIPVVISKNLSFKKWFTFISLVAILALFGVSQITIMPNYGYMAIVEVVYRLIELVVFTVAYVFAIISILSVERESHKDRLKDFEIQAEAKEE